MKTRYHLEVLTPKTMKLFGSTKSKITKKTNHEESITKIIKLDLKLQR